MVFRCYCCGDIFDMSLHMDIGEVDYCPKCHSYVLDKMKNFNKRASELNIERTKPSSKNKTKAEKRLEKDQ